jgi:hypothetical protein
VKGDPRWQDGKTHRFESASDLKIYKIVNGCNMTVFMSFGSRTTVLSSGEGNGRSSGDFGSVKILRHRRGSNTRSSLYESDALPLGHCALVEARKFIDRTVQTIVMTSALFEKSIQEALLLSRAGFLWFFPLSARRSGQVVRRRSRKAKIACSTHVCASKFSPHQNPWNGYHFPPLK